MKFLHALIAVLLIALCSARVIDNNDDIHNDVSDNGDSDHYESDEYNHWVEKILKSFASKHRSNEHDADRILLAVTTSLVSNAASFEVEHAIDEAFVNQCGADKYNERARDISDIISSQNHCLMDAKRKLARHFRQHSSSQYSVKDRVTSQLACSVAPEVLSCFEPALELLLSCTDDVEVGFPIYKEFKEALLQQYCAEDATIAADLISESPSTCISVGMDYYLKFMGPSFIRKMPIVSAIEYPCAISQYIRQMSSVMLPMQCNATSLVKLISHYSHKFNDKIGCLDLYSR